MLASRFAVDAPGAAVILVKNGTVVFRKAYGLANLETGTAMRPEMVFEIGSVTKQFTATAILMLAERGKLSLDDDLRKYFPDYPDKAARITVEHLLTHTSGIKSYTEDPKWPPLWRQDLTPQQVIDLTKDAPLEFPPGSKWNYNNTAYTMLGAIIEKVSGVSYADFIRQEIFEPLRMTHSTYGSFTNVIPNRAAGYTRGASGWENAPYLSMTQPYAAGSLMSNVDDLALWDAAVSSSKLVSKASWDRAFAGFKLADQQDSRYGYGWEIGSYQRRPIIHHGGGIPGYVCHVLRIPQDRVYVAMLTNSDEPPFETDFVVTAIAAEAIDQPYREPPRARLTADALDAYVGAYRVDETTTRTVTRDGERLFIQLGKGKKREIFASSEGDFFPKESVQRFAFTKDTAGKVTAVVSRILDGTAQVCPRIR